MDLNHRPEKLLSPTELRQPGFAKDISARCELSRADLVISRDSHEIMQVSFVPDNNVGNTDLRPAAPTSIAREDRKPSVLPGDLVI